MALCWCKKLSALFSKITSKHDGDCYCLNCFNAFRRKNKLKKHKNVYKNHDNCDVKMSKEGLKIFKYNYG